jgi:hypothetical protein
VNDVNEERGNRDPEELVPIEERKSEQMRLTGVVERYPQQGDNGHQQEKRPRTQRFFRRRRHRGRSSGVQELQEFSFCQANPGFEEEQVIEIAAINEITIQT